MFQNEFTTTGSNNKLLCYYEDDIVLYQNPEHNSCYIYTNVEPENIMDYGVNIYPNPTQENFFLETDLWQKPNTQVHITDIKGRNIKSKNINSQRIEINTKGWQPGVYICNLYVNDQLVRTEKMVLD